MKLLNVGINEGHIREVGRSDEIGGFRITFGVEVEQGSILLRVRTNGQWQFVERRFVVEASCQLTAHLRRSVLMIFSYYFKEILCTNYLSLILNLFLNIKIIILKM